MNESMWMIYLFTRLDSVYGLFQVVTLLSVVAILFCYAEYLGSKNVRTLTVIKIASFVLPVAAIGLILIPTSKDAMFILAGSGVIEAAKSDSAKRIAGKSLEVVEKAMDEYLKGAKK